MQIPAPSAPRQMQLLIWDSEIVTAGDGQVTLKARTPLSHMSVKQAAKVLGCSAWTVSNLYQLGHLAGYKPGARVRRKDGRASNAALRLDSESVLKYKAARVAEGLRERA